MENRIVLIGGTATGKTTLANLLEERTGKKKLITYTTRKRRDGEDESNYKWFNLEETPLPNDRFLYTNFRGEHYFTTHIDFIECGVAVLTYDAIPQIIRHYPDTIFVNLYFENKEIKRRRILSREIGIQKETLEKYMNEPEVPQAGCNVSICIDDKSIEEVYNILVDLSSKESSSLPNIEHVGFLQVIKDLYFKATNRFTSKDATEFIEFLNVYQEDNHTIGLQKLKDYVDFDETEMTGMTEIPDEVFNRAIDYLYTEAQVNMVRLPRLGVVVGTKRELQFMRLFVKHTELFYQPVICCSHESSNINNLMPDFEGVAIKKIKPDISKLIGMDWE